MNEDQVKDIYKERKEIETKEKKRQAWLLHIEAMSEKLKIRDEKTLKLWYNHYVESKKKKKDAVENICAFLIPFLYIELIHICIAFEENIHIHSHLIYNYTKNKIDKLWIYLCLY